jgi:chromosome segregation ATPase
MMSGHDQTYYKLRAKQFKNKEEVLEWADQEFAIHERTEHELRETIAWCKEEDTEMHGTINNQKQMIRNLQQKIIKLQEQLDAQEKRNDRIIDLLTEKQVGELKKMDEEEEEDESHDESEDLCVGCGSSEVKFIQCGGEVGCNMCENCFT